MSAANAGADRRVFIAVGVAAVLIVGGVAVALAIDDDPAQSSPPVTTDVVDTVPTTSAPAHRDDTSASTHPSTTNAAPTTSAPAGVADGDDDVTTVPRSTQPQSAADTVSTSPGSLVEVPVGTVEVLDPVGLDEIADFGDGLIVELVELSATDATARIPGEISGPAIRVDIVATNRSDESIDLSSAQLEVTYGPDRTPSIAIDDPDLRALGGTLEPGESISGSYLAVVPLDERSVIQVAVRYTVDAPVVVFEGVGPL